jgi:hypothetical protein
MAGAQSNAIPGLDGTLVDLPQMTALGREGACPSGLSGVAPRCVAGPVARGALLAGSGGAGTCNALPSEDLNARWTASPTQNPGAGATLRAQFWYRDPVSRSPRRTHISDAVEFVVAP